MALWQPSELVTQEAIYLIGIIIPTMACWVKNELVISSMVAIALLAMFRVVATVNADGEIIRVFTHNALWMESLGNFAVIMLLVFMMVDFALTDSGVIHKAATWFITRKFVEGRPYAIIGMLVLGQIVIGLFMNNIALAIIYLALTLKFCQSLGIEKGHSLWKAIFLANLWGANAVMVSSPIAKFFPNLVIGLARAVRPDDPIVISYAQWFAFGIPFSIVVFLAAMITVRILKPDVSPLMNFKIDEFKKNDPPMSTRGKRVTTIFVILLVFILLPDILVRFVTGNDGFAGIVRAVVAWGPTLPAILAVFIMSLIRADGKPLIDIPSAIKHVNLGLLVFLGVVNFLGSPMGPGFASSVVPLLNHVFSPIFAGLSPFMIATIAVLIGAVITNFVNNAVLVQVFYALGVAVFAVGDPMGPIAFLIITLLATSLPSATPAAILQAALYYGSGNLGVKEALRGNIIYTVLGSAFVIIVMIPVVRAIVPY
jgi:sodium-dependent dicarboxylate transporter 2/3/5